MQGKTALNKYDIAEIKKDFPFFSNQKNNKSGYIYLDNAATSQKPYAVINSIKNFYENFNANVHRAIHSIGEKATFEYEQARKTMQKFINAESSREIIFTRGCTESINLAAYSISEAFLNEGDKILLTEMEHHSNIVPWQLAAERKNLELVYLPFDEKGELETDKLESLWDERIRVMSLVHVSNVFGTINNIKKIIDFAHKKGALVLVDGAQSIQHLKIDVKDLDADFFAFSGHKMMGPTGIGVLYAKEKLLEKMPPYMGGGDMIRSVKKEFSTWNDLPYKFEAGTPNISGAIALAEAVKYIKNIGLENIQNYLEELTDFAMGELKQIPDIEIYGPEKNKVSVIPFNLKDLHPHDLAQYLDKEGIAVRAGHHCAQLIVKKLGIAASARASMYIYNTEEDILALKKAVIKAGRFFSL